MSYPLATHLIDLVELGKGKRRRASGRAFASHIVAMADHVVTRYMPEQEMLGVRKCLRQQLRALQWKSYAFFIPMGGYRYIDSTFELEGRDFILPDSIVATTLVYRASLDEVGTGLRQIIFSDFSCGLEWACYSSIFESEFEQSAATPLLSLPKVEQYIQ